MDMGPKRRNVNLKGAFLSFLNIRLFSEQILFEILVSCEKDILAVIQYFPR